MKSASSRQRPIRRALSLLLVMTVAICSEAGAATGRTPVRSAAPTRASASRTPALPKPPLRKLADIATAARTYEESGLYALAAGQLRELRGRQGPDADLELALALDEARSGQADSAWTRLYSPLLTAALADTADVSRRTDYPFVREPMWQNGKFDGWHWYIARARAELALARGEWQRALEAAVIASSARPATGKEFLLLSLCASHAGQGELADAASAAACLLEPGLPEAHYLRGLLAWRSGRRDAAQRDFSVAARLDSAYRAPALALPRTLLPATRPDSLPRTFLTGARAALVLTSRQRPKLEEFVQMDEAPAVIHNPMPRLPDDLRRRLTLTKPLQLYVPVLVSDAGSPLLIDFPYIPRAMVPPQVVAHVAAALQQWRFRAPVRGGVRQRGWATIEYTLEP